jgi:thiol-disulfide isomerase/thioredoxin
MCGYYMLFVCASLLLADDPPAKNVVPTRPAPNEEFRAAYIEISTQLMDQRKQWIDAKDEQAKEKIMKGMIGTMANKLLPLTRKYPEARESFAFLLECAAAGHQEGIELLLQLHDKKSDLGDACLNLAMQSVPMGDRLCALVLERSANAENRGRACLGYGYWLMKKGDTAAEEGKLEQAKVRYEQAQKRIKEAISDYGSIKIDFGPVRGIQSVKTLASQALNEMDSLTVGKASPDLKGIDLEGKTLSLKEYQGKVVMVSFWAHWCGPCMAFVPHEREIVERYAGKPFVLLGVNGDEVSKEMLEKTKKANVTWRSLQNQPNVSQPKLSEQWNVMTWPTVYLIDAQGIIRKKWIGRVDPKTLDESIENLVKHAEKGQ